MSRNAEMVEAVAAALGDLRGEVVFIGGAVVNLLVTDPAAPEARFTDDVDVVVQVATHLEWASLSVRLRARGFREDAREIAGR